MKTQAVESTSKRVQNKLRTLLIEQRLEPGARLVEAQLCSELGVSRTPIREALFVLEQEGFVKSDPARGFTVRPLSAHEVRELYPMVWTLEILALKLSDDRLKNNVAALKAINKQFLGNTGNAQKSVYLDTRFHETLTGECRNKHLLQQLHNLRGLIMRYEFAYMHESSWCQESAVQHTQIIDSIEKASLQSATSLLEANWRDGMERIANWLDWKKREEE
jgi:DNA-binding GntR family transcriptional regulator